MDLTSPATTRTFHTARWKMALAFTGSLALALLFTWLLSRSPENFRRGSPESVRFFGSFLILVLVGFGGVAFARTVKPDRVVLDPMGFRVEGIFPRRRICWSDVDRFYSIRTGRSSFVAWDLSPEARERHRTPILRLESADGYLWGGFREPHDLVLKTLTEWRRRYG